MGCKVSDLGELKASGHRYFAEKKPILAAVDAGRLASPGVSRLPRSSGPADIVTVRYGDAHAPRVFAVGRELAAGRKLCR